VPGRTKRPRVNQRPRHTPLPFIQFLTGKPSAGGGEQKLNLSSVASGSTPDQSRQTNGVDDVPSFDLMGHILTRNWVITLGKGRGNVPELPSSISVLECCSFPSNYLSYPHSLFVHHDHLLCITTTFFFCRMPILFSTRCSASGEQAAWAAF